MGLSHVDTHTGPRLAQVIFIPAGLTIYYVLKQKLKEVGYLNFICKTHTLCTLLLAIWSQ